MTSENALPTSSRDRYSRLRHPATDSPLALEGSTLVTDDGTSAGSVDDLGIACLASEDYYFLDEIGVDRATLEQLVDEPKMLDAYFEKERREGYMASRYAISVGRSTHVLTASLGRGRRVLDLGCGWGTLSRELTHFSGDITAMDLTYPSLKFSARLVPDITHVHAGDDERLPFADDSFDVVILNGVLEWIAQRPGGDPRDNQLRYLADVRRVLAPGGEVVVGIENRTSIMYFAGKPEDHIGLRFVSLMPRSLANRYARRSLGRDYRNYTYSASGLERLLNDAGFDDTETHWPWLTYRAPDQVFPLRGRNHLDPGVLERGSKMRRRANQFLRVLTKVAPLRSLAPAFAIRGAVRSLPEGLATQLVRLREPSGAVRGVYTTGSSSVIVYGDEFAYKIGNSPTGEDDVRRDFEGTQRALAEESIAGLVCAAELDALDGHSVLVRPILESASRSDATATINTLLRRLGEHPKAEVDFGDIFDFERIRAFAALAGLEECVAKIEASMSGAPVVVAAIHGDLHLGQVLKSPITGEHGVIDWDRHTAAGLGGYDVWSCLVFSGTGSAPFVDRWQSMVLDQPPTSDVVDQSILAGTASLPLANRVGFALEVIDRALARLIHPIQLSMRQREEFGTRLERIAAALG